MVSGQNQVSSISIQIMPEKLRKINTSFYFFFIATPTNINELLFIHAWQVQECEPFIPRDFAVPEFWRVKSKGSTKYKVRVGERIV